jgi:hypothetical protein
MATDLVEKENWFQPSRIMMLLFVFDRRANRTHRPSGEVEMLVGA